MPIPSRSQVSTKGGIPTITTEELIYFGIVRYFGLVEALGATWSNKAFRLAFHLDEPSPLHRRLLSFFFFDIPFISLDTIRATARGPRIKLGSTEIGI